MSGEQLTREIGRSGVSVSAVGLGTWAIGGWMWGGTDEAESIAAIQASLDAGVTHFDTAALYGFGASESIVGQVLAENRPMLAFMRALGFTLRVSAEDAEVMEARKAL